MDRFVITSETLLFLQVCAESNATPQEVEAWAQCNSPAGTSNNWRIITEGEGQAPVTCAEDNGRTHWLLAC